MSGADLTRFATTLGFEIPTKPSGKTVALGITHGGANRKALIDRIFHAQPERILNPNF